MKYCLITFCFLFICNYNDTNIMQQGLYYGRRTGIIPQVMVFAEIKSDTAILDSYIYIKKVLFSVLRDTLIANTNDSRVLFSGKYSIIYVEKNEIYLKTIKIDDERYRIDETLIQLQQDMTDRLKKYKNESRGFDDI